MAYLFEPHQIFWKKTFRTILETKTSYESYTPKTGQNLAKTDLRGIAKPWNKVRACLNYDDTQGFLGSQETNSNGLQPSKWPLYNPWDSLGTCEKIILRQPRVDQNSPKKLGQSIKNVYNIKYSKAMTSFIDWVTWHFFGN